MAIDDPYYEEIWEELRGTCVLCGKPAVTIHEIVPRSRLPKKWIEPSNRVTLCNDCHLKVHQTGWRNWVDILTDARVSFSA